jgi:ribosomal protein S18 acetylase RimI-like enzyme
MPVHVRSASEADVDALIALNKVVQDLHAAAYPRDFKAVVDQAGLRAWFTSRLHEPNSVIVVAERDASPAGYAWFELQVRAETLFNPPRRRIYLHHLSVAPEAQRQGVATSLLRFIEQRAVADGIADIMLDTWMANADAQAFFAARGFAPLQMTFRKTLVPAG